MPPDCLVINVLRDMLAACDVANCSDACESLLYAISTDCPRLFMAEDTLTTLWQQFALACM